MESIIIKPIGTIRTPFIGIDNMPIQPIAAEGKIGYIKMLPEYVEGLTDLEGFSHITLLYHFHKTSSFKLLVKPFMDTVEHGVFACRAPKRPNAIGVSTVKLLGIEKNIIHIEQVDMLDETPLIDIKPFFPKYDNRLNAKAGWLENKKDISTDDLRSDKRFLK